MTPEERSCDTKVKENVCLVFGALFIPYDFIWNRYKNLEYSLFITVLSVKNPKIRISDWIMYPMHMGNV